MKPYVKTWLEKMYKEEIEEVKGAIRNEHLWELAYDDSEDDFNPHTLNIENLKEYRQHLERLISELEEM